MYPFSFCFLVLATFTLCEGALEGNSCGFLYSQSNFTGDKFELIDGTNIANLEETYLTSDQAWNVTSSFQVEKGCSLKVCSGSCFDGTCQQFTENAVALPEGFDNVLSVNCNCDSGCRCRDVRMRKSTCARGYISKDCNTCYADYTNFKGLKSWLEEEFKDKIVSIIVRKGCKLTVYSEEDYEGNSFTVEGINEVWTSPVGSYECVCEGTDEEPIKLKNRAPNSPPFIDVPSSAENISALLSTELGNLPGIGKHPGLVAALKSVKGKRSPKNAYILLIGSTGSGKSTTINFLFDNPNLAHIGHHESRASSIDEIRIPLPIDHLGIQNSELRIIDTPGLGDTRGLKQDAKFLATLEDYLHKHEELSTRIPNIVLVFARFDDRKFEGVGSRFVKMLRGVNSFRDRITDKKFSNVIFVFSHFMSEIGRIRRRPGSRLKGFKRVIEDYSLFPKPISIVVAENKAEEYDLPMYNGYYKLPNGDFYPRNLFEKIESAAINGVDSIGEAVIRTAFFSDLDKFNISRISYPIVSAEHSKVSKYFAELIETPFNPVNTEVSRTLATAYETLELDLRNRFPDALPYIQRSFNIKNIFTRADIPRTTFEIVKFMKDVKKNEAVLYLMDRIRIRIRIYFLERSKAVQGLEFNNQEIQKCLKI